MHAPFDSADTSGCRPAGDLSAGLRRALATVNPGDDDEDEDEDEDGPGGGDGSIEPEPDEGYDEDEDEDDEDPLWAALRAAAHHRRAYRRRGRPARPRVRVRSRKRHTSPPRFRTPGAPPA